MRLKLHSTALATLCGAALASPALALQTQPESNTQVGPAEIRDFSLPGTPPPAEREPEPTPTPAEPPVAEPREPVTAPTPAPPAAAQPTPAPPRDARPITPSPQPRPEAETPTERENQEREDGARAPEPSDGGDALPASPTRAPGVSAPAEASPAPVEPSAVEAPGQQDEGSGWLFPLLAALALAGGAVAILRLRRRRLQEELEAEPLIPPEPEPEPAPPPMAAAEREPVAPAAATPAPAPQAASSDVPGIVMRPWLELIFKPARATATDGGASVQYEALIRNTGNAPARNVRLAARMFNSGQDIQAEVSRFFGMGVDSPDGAPLTILPRTEVALSSVVTMEREEMREIKVQGRSLFVPTVAFNLLYEWGRDKVGQTCSAHVVGREPDTPSDKMAPFRLDLGPRVYRSVGQRPSALARAV